MNSQTRLSARVISLRLKSCLSSVAGVCSSAIWHTAMLVLLGTAAAAQTTYVWNRTGSADWTTATNWTPSRNTPAASDILVFNGNGTSGTAITVTNVPSQTISGLQISNNTSVTLVSPTAAGTYTLAINNGTAVNDFSVTGGSWLIISGTQPTVINMAAGSKALINGNVTFSGAAHRLLGTDAGSVEFASPAVCTAGTGFTGNAFGTTGNNETVIFSAGSSYVSAAGSDPFGLVAPAAKAVFRPGSLFRTTQASGAGMSLSGRSFGNLQFAGSGTANLTGTAGFTVDTLTVSSGRVNIAFPDTIRVMGNLNIARGAVLTFNSAAGLVNLAGALQTVYGAGTCTFSNGQLVEIAAVSTIRLLRSISVSGSASTLTVKGTLNTNTSVISGTGRFVLLPGASLGIGSTSGITVQGTNAGNIRTTIRTYSTGANYRYTGSANQSTGNGLPATINTLTINNTGTTSRTVSLTAAVSITGTTNSLTLQSGILNLNNRQLTLPPGGNILAVAGNFSTTAGPLFFSGNGTVTGTVRFSTVTVSGAVDFGTTSTIGTSLQINSGGSVINNAPLYAGTATLIYACGCGSLNTGQEWLTGTAVGAGVPNNVTINLSSAANSVMISGDRTVVSRLTLSNGLLGIGGHTLTLGGALTRTNGFLKGSPASSLVISRAAGNLFFGGTGTDNHLKNLTLSNGASAALSTALLITAGTGLPNSEGSVTVNGTAVLTTRGLLTIQSNQFGTARVGQGRTTGGYISGNVTVERYIPRNTNKAWRLLASNTSGQTISQSWQENQTGFSSNTNPGYGMMIPGRKSVFGTLAAAQAAGFDTLSPGHALFGYDPATDNLVPIANTNATQLSSSHGYFVFIRGDRSPNQFGSGAPTTATVLRSTGTLFQGNQPAVSIPAGQYALVRNPYASRIDMRNVVRTGGLVDAYQVWDPKLSGASGVGGYQTFTKNTGTGNYEVSPGGGSYAANGSVHNFIESGLAFFVQAVGTSGTVQVTEACKTSGVRWCIAPLTGPPAEGRSVYFSMYMP